jgi:NAD+ synthase (glutamine-hydrolysing)
MIFNLSSSPFTVDKARLRYELIKNHIENYPTDFLYVNQVGAQDEVIFD